MRLHKYESKVDSPNLARVCRRRDIDPTRLTEEVESVAPESIHILLTVEQPDVMSAGGQLSIR